MNAMILAAGEGTRLRPLTLETPKVLLPVGGVLLIEHTLTWLKSHGIKEIAINLHHLGEKIKDFLGDGSHFGVKIHYSPEGRLLGTAGGVKRMEQFFDDTFVVVYGDILTNFNLSAMTQFHQKKKAIVTLAIFQAPNPREVGVVKLNAEGRILSLIEKPVTLHIEHRTSNTEPGTLHTEPRTSNFEHRTLNIELFLASGGIYILEKEVLSHIPNQGSPDFAYDIFPKLITMGLPLYGYILSSQEYLLDIGTMDKYHKAQEIVHQFKVQSATLNTEH
jgi:NDP-sugar pyrophosphorylase family protein